MDPVTTILLQALAVLGSAAGTEVAKRTVGEVWDHIKVSVQRRFGADHEAPKLLEDLRATAANGSAAQPVADRLAAYHLAQDPETLALAQRLATLVAESHPSSNTTMNATNIYGAIGQNSGSVSFNFGDKP